MNLEGDAVAPSHSVPEVGRLASVADFVLHPAQLSSPVRTSDPERHIAVDPPTPPGVDAELWRQLPPEAREWALSPEAHETRISPEVIRYQAPPRQRLQSQGAGIIHARN